MFVLVASVEFHIPAAHSLKAKRSVVQSVVRQFDGTVSMGAAEVGHLDVWQRAHLGLSVVGGSVRQVEQVMDDAERRLWSRPDIDVLEFDRSWWEAP